MKTCKNCGKPFRTKTSRQCFCCADCREEFYKKKGNRHEEPAPGVPIIREFVCKNCGYHVRVADAADHRTVFCSQQCEKDYWKHGYLKRNSTKHIRGSQGMSSGMSLGSLIRREKMDLD